MLALCESKNCFSSAPIYTRRCSSEVDLYRPGVSKGAKKSAAKSDKHYALQFSTFVYFFPQGGGDRRCGVRKCYTWLSRQHF